MGLIDSLAKRVSKSRSVVKWVCEIGVFKKWIRVEELWSPIGDRG